MTKLAHLDKKWIAVVDERHISQPPNPSWDIGDKEASNQDLQETREVHCYEV